ncbi:MAG: ROK family protein [Alkaliphilus sp.]|nr:ROK family protein [Alkaliphilus sp.]
MKLNHDEMHSIAVDIGGSKLMVGIVDREGRVLTKEKEFLKADINEDEIMDLIIQTVAKIRQYNDELIIDGAGVAIPGLADVDKGVWVYSCFTGIRDYEIGRILSSKLNLPVYIDNDVNACAYGEKLYGVCMNDNDFLWVTVSNGVGGGIFLNGELYRGPFMNAGEIGHLIVEENNPAVCPCKNKGCLEAYAAGPAIVRRYMEKTKSVSRENKANLTAKDIADLARGGDSKAMETFRETGVYLGKAISHAVNILNVQKVILGGGVSLSMDLFIEPLLQTLDKWVFKDANPRLLIQKTAFDGDAALIGAAAICKRGVKLYDERCT